MKTQYVLVTPARNEEAYIEKTIESVIAQTVMPQKWVIVSDNSTDSTDGIVRKYAQEHSFIQLVRKDGEEKRTFSSKVYAFRTGYEHVQDTGHDFIGMLDADVSFAPDYYENILKKFDGDKKLGVAGGVRYDLCNGKFVKVLCAKNSVGGPYQLFRRHCFEQIEGFTPIAIGGEDAVAEIKARMYGWRVESFPEFVIYHYRATGSATKGPLGAAFQDGKKCYLLGYHPLFQIVKSIYRMQNSPRIFGGLFLMAGYFYAMLRRLEKAVPEEVVTFLHTEQQSRIKSLLLKRKDFAMGM
jgi:glycosyltransferase involved in cell wall biosynthesis